MEGEQPEALGDAGAEGPQPYLCSGEEMLSQGTLQRAQRLFLCVFTVPRWFSFLSVELTQSFGGFNGITHSTWEHTAAGHNNSLLCGRILGAFLTSCENTENKMELNGDCNKEKCRDLNSLHINQYLVFKRCA